MSGQDVVGPGPAYAGLLDRFSAVMVDTVILAGISILVLVTLGLVGLNFPESEGPLEFLTSPVQIVALVSWTVYYSALEFRSGQTIGKRLARIRVVSEKTNGPAPASRIVVRNLCRWLDFLPLGYLLGLSLILASRKRRRIGDLIAGTVVIKLPRETQGLTVQPQSP